MRKPDRLMWLFVFFDLPVKTKREARAAALFRTQLEKDGFTMFQRSVYSRFCGSHETVQTHIRRVRSFVPEHGLVSILKISDSQYGNMVNIYGNEEIRNEKQGMLFVI